MNKMMKRKWTTGKWGKRLFTAILSAALVLTAATPAMAVQHIDPKKSDCSITLDLKYKDASNTEQQMKDGEEIRLYQVAKVTIDNGYHFELLGAFVGMDSTKGIPDMDGAALGNRDLAKKIAADVDAAKLDEKKDNVKTANSANGIAKFSELTSGLYLVRHIPKTAQDVTFNPFLISVPDQDGAYDVSADPKLSFVYCIIDPPVVKKVLNASGEEITDTTGTFTFQIEADEADAPMPANRTLTLKGSTTAAGIGLYGTIYKDSVGTLSEFGEIQYGQEGSWHYRISEISASDGYSKDETVYTMTVTTKSNEHHKLEAEIVIRDQDENITTENVFTFTNRLQGGGDNPPGGGGNPPGGGRRRRVTPPPTVPTTPGEVLGATRDVGRGVLGAVREPQVLGAVRTGDTNALIIWATILILAVSGFAGWISIYHRKKSTRLR